MRRSASVQRTRRLWRSQLAPAGNMPATPGNGVRGLHGRTSGPGHRPRLVPAASRAPGLPRRPRGVPGRRAHARSFWTVHPLGATLAGASDIPILFLSRLTTASTGPSGRRSMNLSRDARAFARSVRERGFPAALHSTLSTLWCALLDEFDDWGSRRNTSGNTFILVDFGGGRGRAAGAEPSWCGFPTSSSTL
jgi:hypothetical protein